jgi:hypothetical protein
MDILNLSNKDANNDNSVIDLSEYKEAAEIPSPVFEEKSPIVEMGIPPEIEHDNEPIKSGESWEGNPDYFQSGSKKGQKRQRKPRTKVEYTGQYAESEVSADIITGAMFISIIDLLIPMMFITINNYFTGEKLKPSDMTLSAEQQRKLEPVADKAMSYIKLRGNPLILLGLTMLGLYSMQLVKAKMEYKVKLMNEKQDAKK